MSDICLYTHYIVVDDEGRIVDGWSSGPHPERDTGATVLNDHGGYQFRLFPDGEENPRLFDDMFVPLYSWDGSKVHKRSTDEIEADHAAIITKQQSQPTQIDKLEAQVTYTAMMTDTLLEV